MIQSQRTLERLNNELTLKRTALITALAQSNNLAHHSLLHTLKMSNPEHWLELTEQQLGSEYHELITRLEKLEAAVCQIEIGQYGYCCDCEEKIDAQRLIADPANQRCSKCEPD
ncbi:conjugal transfer protein TraR [Pseudoalteromonas shioyasakiensis]|uniref:TraR/DksA C4-type zinc finger protein n=1 Tax=Pseudoalteromonas shioyasakiensis TaxID=1190813 RepID=UPI0021198A15|nr:conjugal transfer protein TraR [Pseudoalteromonas shioyasakiensis]MCQ8877610.1 conjugal transfer protein TraR [Pseudoalteromonas shioyasakiensis]